MANKRRVIEVLNAEKEGLDSSDDQNWYLVERDDHPEIVHPITKIPANCGDCLGVKTKAQAIALRREAYDEKIPLDAL
jgi:hypothetical protein